MTRGRTNRSAFARCVDGIPLFISYAILITTWFGFEFVISIHQVLIRRGETTHFIIQQVIYNVLTLLTILSLLTASTRGAGTPDPLRAPDNLNDQTLPLGEYEKPAPRSRVRPTPLSPQDMDEDDIPLKFLRNPSWVKARVGKDRPSPLPLMVRKSLAPQGLLTIEEDEELQARGDASGSSSESGFAGAVVSPFPFVPSPFVPTSGVEAGEDREELQSTRRTARNIEGGRPVGMSAPFDSVEIDMSRDARGETDKDRLLPTSGPPGERRHGIMAKAETGGPRWCKKCDRWKPDRSHHCRFCQRCTLKMDHHCVWLGTCVGYHNYKPFLLFISYGTLLSVYGMLEAGYETIRFFNDPNDFIPSQLECVVGQDPGCTAANAVPEVDLGPVVFMAIAVLGFFFAISVGTLSGYHWWLASRNMTTLENLTNSYPSALLPVSPKSARSSSTPVTGWKADHLLTRAERLRLRREAREINVYDLGWRRNLSQIFGTSVPSALWPISRPVAKDSWRDGGHWFEIDENKLERLRLLTKEMRLGIVEEDYSETEDEGVDEQTECPSPRSASESGYEVDEEDEEGETSEADESEGEAKNGKVAWFEA